MSTGNMRTSSLTFLGWVAMVNLLSHNLPFQAAASTEENTVLSNESDVHENIPFLVSIQKRDANGDINDEDQPGDHLCGGALLDEYTVLTSAKCALEVETFHYQIVAGTNVLGGLAGRQRRLVSRIIFHPYYDRNKNGRILYNMAIMYVKKPFDFNDGVYAKLPKLGDTNEGKVEFYSWSGGGNRYTKERVKVRQPVTYTFFLVIIVFAYLFYYFGFNRFGYACAALCLWTTCITVAEMWREEEIELLRYEGRGMKMTPYKVLPQEECNNRFFNENVDGANTILCTVPRPGKSEYDSGGLLVQDGVVVGILCRSDYTVHFLRVSAFRSWIERQIRL